MKNTGRYSFVAKEQPEAFVAELFEHIADYSWPWTWVVSDSYRQAVNAFYKTTFKTANNPDEDMPIERQFIYDNPICFGEESLFSRVDEIRVLENHRFRPHSCSLYADQWQQRRARTDFTAARR